MQVCTWRENLNKNQERRTVEDIDVHTLTVDYILEYTDKTTEIFTAFQVLLNIGFYFRVKIRVG